MGQVYLARDTLLDRSVAIKFISGLGLSPTMIERFLNEARAAARIQHPNVVAVYRVGELQARPYLVSEFIKGRSLDLETVPMDWAKVQELSHGLACGLAAAHRCGVLHRDIKPGNVIVASDGQVKLVDFGLAKLEEDLSASRTNAHGSNAITIRPDTTNLSSAAVVDLPSAIDDLTLSPLPESLGGFKKKSPNDSGTLSAMLSPYASLRIESSLAGEVQLIPSSDTPSHWPSLRDVSEARIHRPGSLTHAGVLVGTPLYLAPELWAGKPATPQADVYALGAMIYELCTGVAPYEAEDIEKLAIMIAAKEIVPIQTHVPAIDARLAAVITRCLARDPANRPKDGEAVRELLEKLRPRADLLEAPEGNPYRGLHTFEAEHRALFFGRAAEVSVVLERLRHGQWVLVAGDSGVGKSSLCRAGVLPMVAEGALAEGRKWTVVTMTPGRRPVLALAAVLAAHLGTPEDDMVRRIMDGAMGAIAAELRKDPRGLLVFADQLEELVTVSDPKEAQIAAEAMVALSRVGRGVRVLATVRGDLLTRLASLGSFAESMVNALYLLQRLSPEGIRDAIVGPARAKNVTFESEDLVKRLVESCARAEGGLPLLQFALAELWDARDIGRSLITSAALENIGGVEGALARHADGVVHAMLPAWRRWARTILTMLVTPDLTRRPRTEHELVGSSADAKLALEALVRGRILIVRDTIDSNEASYEISHEALLRGWATLRSWLESDAGRRLIHERLARAVEEWERLGRGDAGLWREQQLAEIAGLEAEELKPLELTFMRAAQDAVKRRRWRRRFVIAGVPLAVMLGVGAFRLHASMERNKVVEKHLATAAENIAQFRLRDAQATALRTEAFRAFDQMNKEDGEEAWMRTLRAANDSRNLLEQAAAALDRAHVVDPDRSDVVEQMGQTYYDIAASSEAASTLTPAEEQRVKLYDLSGELMKRWLAPGKVEISAGPPGARATLARYQLTPAGALELKPESEIASLPTKLDLAPGSYLLTFAAPGFVDVRYPIKVSRGESTSIDPRFPRRAEIPAGFIPIPGGAFFFGAQEEVLRSHFFGTAPLHKMTANAFVIAAHETTFGEWIQFLEALPELERQKRTPGLPDALTGSLALTKPAGKWHLQFRPNERVFDADEGELLDYPSRPTAAKQDWLKMPVTAVSFEDALAYTSWLDATGRVPGARLCTEIEWERAARGADPRKYPHGDLLSPTDANYSKTYGGNLDAVGLDEVGSHPASDSPFGVHDLAGNAFEWVTSSLGSGGDDVVVFRSGSFFQSEVELRTENRSPAAPTMRDIRCGLRICAPWR